MKTLALKTLIPLTALASAGMPLMVHAADTCAVHSGSQVVPLVELYTSQGCSSCPPADRWLSKHYNDGDANFLAFHVDYWDSIGWPDRFASHTYTLRQRSRVAGQGGSTVYTPQVMVGRNVHASWRGGMAFRHVLEQSRQAARAAIALRLESADNGWRAALGAAQQGAAAEGAELWLARYVDHQVTGVQAGENRGVTLHNDRVVLALYGPWKLDGPAVSQSLELPAQASPWGLTAFVQDAQGDVLQSVDLDATACARQAKAS